jgi:hypothetical protein
LKPPWTQNGNSSHLLFSAGTIDKELSDLGVTSAAVNSGLQSRMVSNVVSLDRSAIGRLGFLVEKPWQAS